MERVKNLGRDQKVILLLMFLMILVFAVLYSVTIAKEGYAYKDAILIPRQENGDTIYSGEIEGKQASFTVSKDKIVEFQYGDKIYGTYVIKEDATAITPDNDMGEGAMGIELYCEDEVIFRGSARKMDDYWWLANEDGTSATFNIYVTTSDGSVMDGDGNVIDPMEPSVSNILDLVTGPKLTHKGNWFVWILGVVICVATAISILFADELFRWNLLFQIRNVDHAEPSEWEITRRYVSWTVIPIIAMILFIVGLQ